MNASDLENIRINPDLSENIKKIKDLSGGSSDVLVNRIDVSGIKVALLCCEGMISTATLTELILLPLTRIELENSSPAALFNHIENKMLLSIDRSEAADYGTFFRFLNSGFAMIAAEGMDRILAFGVQGYDKRGVDEPSGENNITGAQDGFVEVVRTNMSLLRRRMKSPNLVQKLFVLGDKSRTDICICYMQDRVPENFINKIMKSLENVELETVLSSGYIQPFVESGQKHIFNSTGTTERPDVLCSKLIEGRVALLIDGTPFAIIIPKLFNDSFQTLDDYNFKPYFATFIRWLKYAAFFMAILLPSIYVAIAIHHPELLNSTLLLILAQAEENAPFSVVAETLGVLLMYEIIKEAGLRLPKAVGGAVSIVGGLIIGDAAVTSGLISTPLLTVAALSVVSGFVLPDLSQSITVLRLIFTICGGLWGLYGISLLCGLVLINVCATEDYGYPFTAPVSPFSLKAMRDVAVRSNFKKMQNDNFTVEDLYE